MTSSERLKLIAKSMRHCNEIVTREALRVQFRYETGSDPAAQDLNVVLRQVAREAEK